MPRRKGSGRPARAGDPAAHDVIVVGAGPAGSCAALGLALVGRRVLLLDRSPFPRDKPCGDAVPFECFPLLRLLGLGDRVDAVRFYPSRTFLHVDEGGTVTRTVLPCDPVTGQESVVVPRREFDALLWQGALDAGVEFEVGHVSGPLVENGRVVGVRVGHRGGVERRARVVIAADGSTSGIGRALMPYRPSSVHRGVAIRAYARGMQREEFAVEFHAFRGSYAWVFPTHGDVTNIGVGLRLDTVAEVGAGLRAWFDAFLALPHVAPRLQGATIHDVATWPINMGSLDFDRAFHGALLVGDAGWFADPLTGGGIHNAIASGMMAARVVHEAIEAGDVSREFLRRYDEEWRRTLWPALVRSTKLQRAMHRQAHGHA